MYGIIINRSWNLPGEGMDMWKRINALLAGLPMTLAAGVFLLASFVLPRIGLPAGVYFAWVAVIICGIPLLYLAIWRIIHNKGVSKISSALLICIAALLIGDLFAAGEVAFIMALGALLEDATTNRAKKGLKNLLSLTPQQGRRITDGQGEFVPVESIRKDDLLRVLPGETIPVDGVIVTGETSVDQSIMTGESLPVDKTVGDTVFCGTINRFGSVDIRATNVGEDSSLQKLIRMVQDAENRQAPTQRIADHWASWLVPVALAIAVITWLATKDIVRAVTVLVVFCPCSLVLATPTAIMAAIGQAAKHGVIIKSGEALETMGRVGLIAFDKTGTLTEGMRVSDVLPVTAISPEELLATAASAEGRSEHPLGKAIVEHAKGQGLAIPESADFHMTAGRGVSAVIGQTEWLIGSESFLLENGVTVSEGASALLSQLRKEGKDTVIVADREKVAGVIALSDTLRPEAREAVEKLRRQQITPVLLTGDHRSAAEYLSLQLGITEVRANLLPEDKVSNVEGLKEKGRVCMIGDGVNDAPALKTADVGVAMGVMGSDIAVEAADVALMSDDLRLIPYLKWLSNTTVKTIRGAISLSMGINLAAVTLSVLGILTPTTGALVHNAGSCFVVLLAALLYDRRYQ